MNRRWLLFLAICLISTILASSLIIYELGLIGPSVPSGAPWQRTIENFAVNLAVVDGKVFTLDGTEGNVNCFDSQSGKSIWNSSIRGGWRSQGLVISGSQVYFGFPNSQVGCLDENTGKLLWTFQNEQAPNRIFKYSPGIIVKDDRVFALTDTISAHNATTGELLWQAIPGGMRFGTIIGPNETWSVSGRALNGDLFDANYVYVIAGDFSSMRFFKLNTDNGSILWSSDVTWDGTVLTWGVDYGVWAPRVLAVSQGQVIIKTVFSGTSAVHLLFALDSNSGKELWSINVGADIYGPTVYNNLLLFSKADGYVYAVNLAKGTIEWKTKVDTQNLFSFNSSFNNTVQTSPIKIDSQNQRLFWSLNVKESGPSSNYTGILCSLNLVNGNVKWLKQLENENASFGGSTGLVFNNDTDKLFLTKNNGLWIFNASTGDFVQSQQFDHYVLSPIVQGNKTFVVGDLKLAAYV